MSYNDLEADLQKDISSRNLPKLLKRDFISIKNDKSANGPSFRVLQWNILAKALSGGSDNFTKCPPEGLEWENRKLRIVEELIRFRPSIICLEEVDAFSFLEESLKKCGYSGIFLPKPDSPCLMMEDNLGPDGCAIFYLPSRFNLLEQKNISLKNESGMVSKQIALACKFEIKEQDSQSSKGATFCIAVTHLKAKAGFEKLRHAQGKSLLEAMRTTAGTLPLIVCGDFNAAEDEAVYDEFARDDLNLRSVCTHLTKDGKDVAYTTWKIRGTHKGEHEVCKTEDYIWYSKEKFVVKSVLSIPVDEEIGKSRLPCLAYPSDHFSLACDIQLI